MSCGNYNPWSKMNLHYAPALYQAIKIIEAPADEMILVCAINYDICKRRYEHTIEMLEKWKGCDESSIEFLIAREPKEFRPSYDKINNVQKKVRRKTNRKKKRRR